MPLNDKEIEILTWIARGKTAWEVATILGLSRRTVEWHLKNSKAKLQATNITHAVATAVGARKIAPSFITLGAGLIAAMAQFTIKMLEWADLIGPPGGIA